jgi:MOSC domain-containing protein YiiM
VSSGVVDQILVASTPLTPPTAIAQAHAVAGRGLEGDRYHAGLGTWSHYSDQTGSDLTLIEAEVLEAVRLTGAQARRNLVTRGIHLNELVGQPFRVGEIECHGVRLCEPCTQLERATGLPVSALVHRGGLRADILSDGWIALGDPIRATPTTPHDLAALSDTEVREVLAHCRFRAGGQRLGLVPFNAHCVIAQLANRNGLDPAALAVGLERWAQALGGEIIEGEVLWLPANQFDVLKHAGGANE